MANRSTNTSLGLNKRIDGHLLGYLRNTFVAGAGASVTVFNKVYYAFTSPGSISLSTPNPLGFSWTSSPDAVVRIITISPGQSGNNALFPGSPSGPNSTGSGAGGSSGTVRVLVSEPISPYGTSIPIAIGSVPAGGVGVGSTAGGDRGASPSYPVTTPGFAGTSFSTPTLSPYTSYFPDYTFSSGGGGAGGNTTYWGGPFGSGGGGGAGGLVITATGSPTPTLSVAPVTPVNASNGNPGGGPTPNGRTGGAGGTGGSGFGAGGGGGGGPVEDFGNNSPGGSGGAGAAGVVLVVIEGTIPV